MPYQYRAVLRKPGDYHIEPFDALAVFRIDDAAGTEEIAQISWQMLDPCKPVETPTFRWRLGSKELDPVFQGLVDIAYEMGYRPKGFEDNAGELAATKRHLTDMRAMAFSTTPKEIE